MEMLDNTKEFFLCPHCGRMIDITEKKKYNFIGLICKGCCQFIYIPYKINTKKEKKKSIKEWVKQELEEIYKMY